MAKNKMDYNELAEGIAEMREAVRAAIAGLVADGFTHEQARIIITGAFAESARQGDQP